MSVLMWVAVLVAGWCVASVVAALILGSYLRHRAEATDPHGALRPLDTGPLWLRLDEVPSSPAGLDEPDPWGSAARTGVDGAVPDLPAPRAAGDRRTAATTR